MTKDLIEVKASELRSDWGLSSDEPINIKRLLLRLNILTLFKSLDDTFSGMCLKRDGNKFILVNADHPVGRQNFTIGHEFFHLFVQKSFEIHLCNPGSNLASKQEKDADFFSSVLLMPEMGIKKMITEPEITKKKVSLATVLKLEQYFGVSRSALLVRLKVLKLISNNIYNRLAGIPVIRSAKEYGYDTAIYLPGNKDLVIGDYGVKARNLFEQGSISEGHYIELLSKIGVDPTRNNE
jgi:Zn-dependent peptidase ImmA (M78 family)